VRGRRTEFPDIVARERPAAGSAGQPQDGDALGQRAASKPRHRADADARRGRRRP
jgi:hypothetical protein